MKRFLERRTLGMLLSLSLVCSCTTEKSIRPRFPADLTINKDAGRGGLLIVPVRLRSGQKLPFILDTGAGCTLIDKSLEPILGRPLRTTVVRSWGVESTNNVYVAPKLYFGGVPLSIPGTEIATWDLNWLSSRFGRPIMGILGADVLEPYCIQLDFAEGKMRFLDGERSDKKKWGKAFPIVALDSKDARPAVSENLFGAQGPRSLIDTGCNYDGWLTPQFFQQWTNQTQQPTKGVARSPNGMFGGVFYPDVDLNENDVAYDGVGLRFLSRHLVTLDFPDQTIYLKRTSEGPLVDEDVEVAAKSAGRSAVKFLRSLEEKGQLPGWSNKDKVPTKKVAFRFQYPNTGTFDLPKKGDSAIYHYQLTRASNESPWRLQKAWRTDQSDKTVEEYRVANPQTAALPR